MASDRTVVQSLDRALSILDVLSVARGGMSLGAIAAETGLAKSTTHRLLSTLELRGFVSRDLAAGTYRAGFKATPGLASVTEIHGVLLDLARRSGETANLGTLAGRDVVYVDRAESPQALRWQLGVGSRVPAHCSGLGKAILAFLDDAAVQRVLTKPRRTLTDRTITDADALRAELALTRRRGHAIDNEEFMDGVRCVAVPVLLNHGEVAGAISLAGPAFRLTTKRAGAQVAALHQAAGRVARLLAERGAGQLSWAALNGA
jgi:IclR family transcriptional regulator, KDG regulon repressor